MPEIRYNTLSSKYLLRRRPGTPAVPYILSTMTNYQERVHIRIIDIIEYEVLKLQPYGAERRHPSYFYPETPFRHPTLLSLLKIILL